ncbi:MAG TPA: serine hydrolase domain-containing protein [Roseiarcus sp.]|nr:serine hydrolase domain-containing protein [Roseiarcus sp.]
MTEDFAGLPVAEPESIGLSTPGLERFAAILAREIAAGRAPGASLMVARHGKVGLARAMGAIRPGGPPMPLDALFRIYSMTKPVVSVAAMTLVEEGRLFLTDPLSQYLPVFKTATVGLERAAMRREITVHDLLRHTSGLCYGFTGASPVQQQVHAAGLIDSARDPVEAMAALAALPLMHQPGTAWEYGLSTDVLGRVVEIVAGAGLGEVLRARIFDPLGMSDTGFHTPPEQVVRRAEPHGFAMLDAAGVDRMNHTAPPRFEMAGTGLISTLADYARFSAMLARGGAPILGPRTLALMASNHILPGMAIQDTPLMPPGHGFGLGFAVRTDAGLAPTPGAVGDFFWGGVAGTAFVVSPGLDMFAVMMVQAAEYREHFRNLFRNGLGAALL